MLALYEFWTRLYENYFVRVRVLENSVRRFKNYLVIVRVFENCSVLVCVFKNIVRLYKNNMESGSSYMKSLWNPVRLLKLGPVFLKIFQKTFVFLKNSLFSFMYSCALIREIWIEDKTTYCTCSPSLVIHNGSMTKIIYSCTLVQHQ